MANNGGPMPVGCQSDVAAQISRRTVFRHVAASGAGAALLLVTTSPAAAKMSQKDVGYQQMPKGDQSCSNCGLFSPPRLLFPG